MPDSLLDSLRSGSPLDWTSVDEQIQSLGAEDDINAALDVIHMQIDGSRDGQLDLKSVNSLKMLARICRIEKGREAAVNKDLKSPLLKLCGELHVCNDETTAALLQAVGNLIYENESLQKEFGFLKPKLASIIKRNSGSSKNLELVSFACGCLQNTLLDDEDENQSDVSQLLDDVIPILNSDWLSADSPQYARVMSLFVRLADFDGARKTLMSHQGAPAILMSHVRSDSPFLEGVLSILETLMMEDCLGHETFCDMNLVQKVLEVIKSPGADEDVTKACANVLVAITSDKTVADSLLDDLTQDEIRVLKEHQSQYVRGSLCLFIGNFAYDETSTEKTYEKGYFSEIIRPALKESEILFRTASLAALKNFLVCPTTRQKLLADEALLDELVGTFADIPPMDSRNYFQIIQNIRLLVNSEVDLCSSLLQNSEFIDRLLESSKSPYDHIKFEANRLLASIATSASNSEKCKSVLNLDRFTGIFNNLLTLLHHDSYLMENEGVVSLTILTQNFGRDHMKKIALEEFLSATSEVLKKTAEAGSPILAVQSNVLKLLLLTNPMIEDKSPLIGCLNQLVDQLNRLASLELTRSEATELLKLVD